MEESRDTSCVDALPLQCGSGKSTFVSQYIYNCIRDKRGLIVVTDSVDRLSEYTSGLADFLQRNRQHIAFLTSDTYREEIKTARYKSVVAMTTQRYFSLTREEIIDLTRYQDGKRETVIFDERPFLTEILRIDISVLDEIDATLHSAIDNRDNQQDKQWLISQWENVCRYIKDRISEYESRNTGYEYTVYHFDETAIIDDPARFTELITKFKSKLRKYNYAFDAYKHMTAVQQLLSDGATFTSKKLSKKNKDGTEYCNYFLVLIDNRDKLVNIGAKVFVLDGTAAISPEYDVSYINMVDCGAFQTALDNLTINVVDVKTGKGYLTGKGSEAEQIIDCLISYQNSLPIKDQVLFTYKTILNRYGDKLRSAYEHIDYFGNIKGKNEYREYTNIIQFGLNRYPQTVYDLQRCFSILEGHDGDYTCYVGPDYSRAAMIDSILADIEQNLYRSKIRNQDSTDPIVYTIMFDRASYSDLIDELKKRYEPLGARVIEIESPLEFEIRKTNSRKVNGMTYAQRVLNWGRTAERGDYWLQEILDGCGLTYEQYKSAKKNEAVKRMLREMKTNVRGLYRK